MAGCPAVSELDPFVGIVWSVNALLLASEAWAFGLTCCPMTKLLMITMQPIA